LITARLAPPQALPAAPDVAPPAPIAKPRLETAPRLEPAAPLAPSIPASPAASAESTSAAPSPSAEAEPEAGPIAPSAEPAADAGSVDQYRLQLVSAARRYKPLPAHCPWTTNWEGDVVVRMVIGADGMIASVSVKTGSGHEVLDSQALEMFKRAKPLVPIPLALLGKEFILELRAIYNLMVDATADRALIQ